MVGLNTIINKIQSTNKLLIWLQMYFLPLAIKNQRKFKFKENKFYFEHIVTKQNKTKQMF